MGGAEAVILVLSVAESQEFLAIMLPSPRLHPDFARLHHGQQNLLSPGSVHLLADDVFDFLHASPCQRHEGVDARRELIDVTGAQHELVTWQFGVDRRFLARKNKGLRISHERFLIAKSWSGESARTFCAKIWGA